jgi:hypothetical protein
MFSYPPDTTYYQSNVTIGPGGGAGGTIWLELNKISLPSSGGNAASAAKATQTMRQHTDGTDLGLVDYPSDTGAGDGTIIINLPNSNGFLNVSADGGSGRYYSNPAPTSYGTGGAGGGGKIYLTQIFDSSGTKITKTLLPVKHSSATTCTDSANTGRNPNCWDFCSVIFKNATNETNPNCFNPYATILGDRIQVKIAVNELKLRQAVDLSDDLLSLPQNAALVVDQRRYCAPVANTYSNASVSADKKMITWLRIALPSVWPDPTYEGDNTGEYNQLLQTTTDWEYWAQYDCVISEGP